MRFLHLLTIPTTLTKIVYVYGKTNAAITTWSEWEACLDTGDLCNRGIQRRTRVCNDTGCSNGVEVQTRQCKIDPLWKMSSECRKMESRNPHFEAYNQDSVRTNKNSDTGKVSALDAHFFKTASAEACQNNPCGRFGNCVPTFNANPAFVCHCQPGYMGSFCDYKLTARELNLKCRPQSITLTIASKLINSYGLEAKSEYLQLRTSQEAMCAPHKNTQNTLEIVDRSSSLQQLSQMPAAGMSERFKFVFPTTGGACGNIRKNIDKDKITVTNTVIWQRNDPNNQIYVQVPLANVTCVFDKGQYFGLTAGPIYPVKRTALLVWREHVTFQARMYLYKEPTFTQPLDMPRVLVGHDIYVQIRLADEDVSHAFDTSNLVTIVEECFATPKDSPNEPQSFFISNKCVSPGMNYFAEILKSGSGHDARMRFKIFEWKNMNRLQEIYFRCRISVCDLKTEDCSIKCPRSIRRRKRRQIGTDQGGEASTIVTSAEVTVDIPRNESRFANDFETFIPEVPKTIDEKLMDTKLIDTKLIDTKLMDTEILYPKPSQTEILKSNKFIQNLDSKMSDSQFMDRLKTLRIPDRQIGTLEICLIAAIGFLVLLLVSVTSFCTLRSLRNRKMIVLQSIPPGKSKGEVNPTLEIDDLESISI